MMTTPTKNARINAVRERAPATREKRKDVGDLSVALVRLEHVAAAKAPADAHHGEENGEEPPEASQTELCEAALQVSHRSAQDVSVLADFAIHLTERAFGEFRRHAEEAGDDHPKNRARAAHGDRYGNPRDVAEANRRRQGRGERLEVGDLARVVRIVVVARRHHPRVPKRPDVDEAEPQREEDGAGDEPKDDERELQIVFRAVVPKDQVEKEDLGKWSDHVGAKPAIDRLEHAADACRLRGLSLGEGDTRPQIHP